MRIVIKSLGLSFRSTGTNEYFNCTHTKLCGSTCISAEEWEKKKAGATRRWTGGKGFTLPSEMLLSEVGQCWGKNLVHASPTLTLSLTSTSAQWMANLAGVNCLLISQSVWLITLVSSLASSRSEPLSSNFRAMVFSFASMSWSLELKSSFTSLVCWTSLSLAWT